jgi:hypothetical protein
MGLADVTSSPAGAAAPEPDAQVGRENPTGDALAAFIEAQHPALYPYLQDPTPAHEWVDVRSLPRSTQQWVWRLYRKHYPELAQWLRELDMEAWRAQFGATLQLRAADLWAAARLEMANGPSIALQKPPG